MSRRLKYVLVGLSGLVLLLVTAALTIPYLIRDRLHALLEARVSAAIDADVRWASLELSFLRGFPHLGITAREVRVCNRAPFDGLCLAEVAEVSARVALVGLLRDTLDVRSLYVGRPVVRLAAREDGLANWQITRAAEPGAAPTPPAAPATSRLRLALRDYRIEDAHVAYADHGARVVWEVAGLDHAGEGDVSRDAIVFDTTTRAERATLSVKDVAYFRDAQVEAAGAVRFDRIMRRIVLEGTRLRLNALALGIEGTATPAADELGLDVRVESRADDLAGLVSLLPPGLVGDLQGLETAGAVALTGRVQGTWSDAVVPAVDVRLTVRDGRFKYASLPAGVDAIALEGAITSAQAGDWDQLVIDVARFTARFAGQPVEGRLRLATLTSDPTIGLAIRGGLDLADVPRLVPFPAGETLTGHADADVQIDGRVSALERPASQRFAADGYVHLRDVLYRPATSNREVHATALSLTFNPRHLQLLAEGAGVGTTDVTIRGRFENYLGWWFGDGVLGGTFEVNGSAVDLASLLRDDEAAAEGSEATPRLAGIPEAIDVTIQAAARRVSYGAIDLGGVRGRLRLHDRRAELHDLGFGLFGGTVTLNGVYDTRAPARPLVQFSYAARGLDLQQAARLSASLRAVAPAAVAAAGTFDSTLDLTGALSPSLALDLASLAGRGSVSSTNVRLDQFAPLTALARALKIGHLENAALGDVRFSFVLRDGRMITSPFDVRLGDVALRVGGSTAFATRAIDYDITGRVPTSVFGAEAAARVSEWLGPAAGQAMPALLGITARLTGSVAQPSVAIAFEAAGAASTARAAALANARAEADRLLGDAEAQAAEIRREAEEAAARLNAEADEAAERLVAEAENPLARAAARMAAGRMRQQAAARADDLVEAAARRAEAVLEAARQAGAERVDAASPRSP
jgi:hypothetical protein